MTLKSILGIAATSLLFVSVASAHPASQHAKEAKAPAKRATKAPVRPWSPRKDCSGTYGTASKQKAIKVTLAELIKNHSKYKGKLLHVNARVTDVCPKKGCWMMLTDGKHLMRVRFKNYSFFMPTNSTGYGVMVEGFGRMTTVSVRMAKHYALDRGDKAAAAKITKPQTAVAFTANWVRMYKLKK